jgi:ribosomal protein S18 acetylase RimI-like enzyme
VIRPLTAADIDELLELRREALRTDPEAFTASEQDDVGLDRVFVLEALAQPTVQTTLGAFEGDVLVGMTGVHRMEHEKERHKALLWGMFVRPAYRGHGHGRGLLEHAIGYARSLDGVTHLQLCVSDSAPEAHALYQSYGFTVWGVEPDSFRVGDKSIGVRHMSLDLSIVRSSIPNVSVQGVEPG